MMTRGVVGVIGALGALGCGIEMSSSGSKDELLWSSCRYTCNRWPGLGDGGAYKTVIHAIL